MTFGSLFAGIGGFDLGLERAGMECRWQVEIDDYAKQFEDGMSWDNFGARGWVIDHILPVSRFDFRKITHVRKACHYRNLRPCWEAENIRKGNRLMPY